MKSRTTRLALVTLLLLVGSVHALADVALPNSAKHRTGNNSTITSSMIISPDEKAKEARLLIPRDLLRQLQAGLDGNDAQSSAAATSGLSGLSGAQTVMAGIFLSLALAFGGIHLLRSRQQTDKLTRAALGVAILALCGASASLVYGNAGPPPVARSLTSKILIQDLQWWGAYGQVKVEIVEDSDQVRLVLPKAKEQPK